jgi:PPOX class probable F420-dependent enzyme
VPHGRDRIRMTDDEIDALLERPTTMQVATFNPDGTIHLVALWHCRFEGRPCFHTFAKSQKVQNLRRDPRLTCMVETGGRYDDVQGVQLVGEAELVEDAVRLREVVARVVARYFPDLPQAEVPTLVDRLAPKRVAVKVHVDHVVSWDHVKLDGGY